MVGWYRCRVRPTLTGRTVTLTGWFQKTIPFPNKVTPTCVQPWVYFLKSSAKKKRRTPIKGPVQQLLGLRDSGLCRKKMAFWSSGPKCGNYFHAAESGRRCDQMTLSIPDLCPCAIRSRPFGLPYGYFFTTQRHESRRRWTHSSCPGGSKRSTVGCSAILGGFDQFWAISA